QVALKAHLEPEQFAYSLVTRSQRVSHESLRARDRTYLESFERWLCRKATHSQRDEAVPPMFLPLELGAARLPNRAACSPMDMYSAVDGVVGDFHLVHLGTRALGGAGLIFTEMTCVSPAGRITPGCAGLYNDEQMRAYRRIVEFVHANSEAVFALQLGHSGAKGSTRKMWEGENEPLPAGNWPVMSASAQPWSAQNQGAKEMTRADVDAVRKQFIAAAQRGIEAGFDILEMHAARGYLLSSFISPVTNRRRDEYGGTLENRLRYPLEVFRALREVWPKERAVGV